MPLMTPPTRISTLCIVAHAPLPARALTALEASPFGPFAIRVCATMPEATTLLADGSADALIVDASCDAVTAQAIGLAASDTAVLVLAVDPVPDAVITWLQCGVQEVLVASDLLDAALPQRVRAAIERHRVKREARHRYATDLNTGLPHQQQLIEHMSHLLALREREPSPMALLVLRIEGLATTEARLGREAANVLRRKVAVRLRAGVRASDVVASLGEDSFSVLLAAMLAASDAQHVGNKLLASLTTPFKVAGQDVALAVSLGIAQYPQDGRQPQALLTRAVGLATSSAAQGRAGFANFTESGGIGPAAANDD